MFGFVGNLNRWIWSVTWRSTTTVLPCCGKPSVMTAVFLGATGQTAVNWQISAPPSAWSDPAWHTVLKRLSRSSSSTTQPSHMAQPSSEALTDADSRLSHEPQPWPGLRIPAASCSNLARTGAGVAMPASSTTGSFSITKAMHYPDRTWISTSLHSNQDNYKGK